MGPQRTTALRLLLGVLPLLAAGGPAGGTPEAAVAVVDRAVAEAGGIDEQAGALARLAWFQNPRDPEVASLARKRLVGFGKHGLRALGQAVIRVDPVFSADVTMAIFEARLQLSGGIPAELLPALDNALWFGSVDAKRLAMRELALFRFRPALLPMIDAAHEFPELREEVARNLPALRDDRARHFLGELLRTGDAAEKKAAAEALARIGGRCIDTLREAVLSEDPAVRAMAVERLLPHTGLDSLTTLHEYAILHPDDDPALLEKVRLRAAQLESLLERQLDYDSASPDPED